MEAEKKLYMIEREMEHFCTRVANLPVFEECKFFDIVKYRSEVIELFRQLNKKYKKLSKEDETKEKVLEEFDEVLEKIRYIDSYLIIAERYKSTQ